MKRFIFLRKRIEKLERGGDMPRVRDLNRKKAFELYQNANGNIDLIEIADKLKVSSGTVRGWKSKDQWEQKLNEAFQKKQMECSKRTKGGQIGNQNAKGSKGGSAPLRNKNAEKHGVYSKIYWDSLDDEELDLIDSMTDAEEEQLIMQLQMFSIRERRFMKNIKKYQEIEQENHGLAVEEVSKTKNIEDLINMDGESIASGKYKKVKKRTVTKTKSVMNSIMALEAELTKIQRAKTKAIDALAKIRLEKQKLESENAGNDDVYDWMEAVLREDEASDE